MLELLRGLVPSLVRTVTPAIVGFIVMVVVKAAALVGLDITWTPSPEVFAAVSGFAGFVFYAIVRWLETQKNAKWGWLLGLPVAPTYGNQSAEEVVPTSVDATDLPVEGHDESYVGGHREDSTLG